MHVSCACLVRVAKLHLSNPVRSFGISEFEVWRRSRLTSRSSRSPTFAAPPLPRHEHSEPRADPRYPRYLSRDNLSSEIGRTVNRFVFFGMNVFLGERFPRRSRDRCRSRRCAHNSTECMANNFLFCYRASSRGRVLE